MWQTVHWSYKIVKWVKGKVDGSEEEHLEKAKDLEGCPHIEMISGWTQPFNDMVAHLSQNGGIAWKSHDGNAKWYWHRQEDFKPLHVRKAWRGRRISRVPLPIKGTNCRECVAAIRRREI